MTSPVSLLLPLSGNKLLLKRGAVSVALLLVSLFLAACGQLLSAPVDTEIASFTPGNYQLDKHHTTVLFKVSHLGVSHFVGRFNRSEAELDFSESDPSASRIQAEVDMTSLDVNRPDFADTLTGCQWLCVERYPKARFVSEGRATVTGSELLFSGELTFRGVAKPAQLWVKLNGATTNRLTGDYVLGFDAKLNFLRSDFGMGQYVPAVGDEVSVEVYAEFIRQ